MDSNTAQFTGSIPQYYDAGMGPVLFTEYARVVGDLVAGSAPHRILELAAGTGISSAAIARANPDADLVVTDLNAPMLEFARAKLPEGTQVEVADAQDLRFDDASQDVVVCQFGIMFLPDLERGFREARRVLAPGGRYIFSVWDSHANNAFAAAVDGILRSHFPDDPPQFYAVPFSRAAVDPLRELAQSTGFGRITVHVVPTQPVVASWTNLADGLILGNPVSDQIRARGGDLDGIKAEVVAALESTYGAAPANLPMQALFHVAEAV